MERNARTQEMLVFFNEKAKAYDAVHMSLMENKEVIAQVLPEGTQKVLDLGAGTGLELIPLFARFPQAEVTAIEVSPAMLHVLQQRPFVSQVQCVCGDFFSLPLGGGYDAVISSAALHHFSREDKAELYARCHAALCPGGVFVNCDRMTASLQEEEQLLWAYEATPTLYRHMDTPLAMETEQKLLEAAGFSYVQMTFQSDGRYALAVARKL